MKQKPMWLIPIADRTMPSAQSLVLTIDEEDGSIPFGTDGPGGALFRLSPIEAASLSLALQEASRDAARLAHRRRKT